MSILIQDVSNFFKRLWHSRNQIDIRKPGGPVPTLGGMVTLLLRHWVKLMCLSFLGTRGMGQGWSRIVLERPTSAGSALL